jgi:hypothetical protein
MRMRVHFSNGEIWEWDAQYRRNLYLASRYARLNGYSMRFESLV